MKTMKYVIFREQSGLEIPILFPSIEQHWWIADRFKPWEPVSAGFVEIMDGKLVAFGESTTLNLKSSDYDTDTLNRFIHSI